MDKLLVVIRPGGEWSGSVSVTLNGRPVEPGVALNVLNGLLRRRCEPSMYAVRVSDRPFMDLVVDSDRSSFLDPLFGFQDVDAVWVSVNMEGGRVREVVYGKKFRYGTEFTAAVKSDALDELFMVDEAVLYVKKTGGYGPYTNTREYLYKTDVREEAYVVACRLLEPALRRIRDILAQVAESTEARVGSRTVLRLVQ